MLKRQIINNKEELFKKITRGLITGVRAPPE
jgi:hypothetical protein